MASSRENLPRLLHSLLKKSGLSTTAGTFTRELASELAKELRNESTSSTLEWDDDGETETSSSRSFHKRNPLDGFDSRGTKRRRRNPNSTETSNGRGGDFEDFLVFALDQFRNKRSRGSNFGKIEKKYASYTDLRKEIIKTSIHMQSSGLVLHTSGNVSIRVPDDDLMLITPTGMDYKELKPEDIVLMDFEGNVVPNEKRAPSSEWRFHGDIYLKRSDAKAIVHTHSTYCTTLACLRRDVPAFHYMIGAAGGKTIRCGKYATYGTQELSDNALSALKGRQACLLANHGMISLGKNLKSAMKLAEIVENLCEMYWRTLAVSGPVILDDQEMDVVLEGFKTYGKQPKKS
eukprot:jgi/Bigna1/50375/estExt_Genewise1.C_760013